MDLVSRLGQLCREEPRLVMLWQIMHSQMVGLVIPAIINSGANLQPQQNTLPHQSAHKAETARSDISCKW